VALRHSEVVCHELRLQLESSKEDLMRERSISSEQYSTLLQQHRNTHQELDELHSLVQEKEVSLEENVKNWKMERERFGGEVNELKRAVEEKEENLSNLVLEMKELQDLVEEKTEEVRRFQENSQIVEQRHTQILQQTQEELSSKILENKKLKMQIAELTEAKGRVQELEDQLAENSQNFTEEIQNLKIFYDELLEENEVKEKFYEKKIEKLELKCQQLRSSSSSSFGLQREHRRLQEQYESLQNRYTQIKKHFEHRKNIDILSNLMFHPKDNKRQQLQLQQHQHHQQQQSHDDNHITHRSTSPPNGMTSRSPPSLSPPSALVSDGEEKRSDGDYRQNLLTMHGILVENFDEVCERKWRPPLRFRNEFLLVLTETVCLVVASLQSRHDHQQNWNVIPCMGDFEEFHWILDSNSTRKLTSAPLLFLTLPSPSRSGSDCERVPDGHLRHRLHRSRGENFFFPGVENFCHQFISRESSARREALLHVSPSSPSLPLSLLSP
jgi:uncharacterized protein YoxC